MVGGEWRVASGEWRVASGEWRVAGGEWQNDPVPTLSLKIDEQNFFRKFIEFL